MKKAAAGAAYEKTSKEKKKSSPDYAKWARHAVKASEDEAASKPSSGLYVIATPIGNLGDISLRALHVLARVDAVACEDTRVTGALLHRYGIKKPLISYYDHNAERRLPELIAQMKAGESVALVSDAGTPLISDPGYKLVQACRAEGIAVVAVPGASALLTALPAAGLPTDRFLFEGFLPSKSAARQKALSALAAVQATLVFYEAPSRLGATLEDMAKTLGAERPAAVARELTKLFEETRTATLGELAAHYRARPAPKGEIVILAGPPVETETASPDIDALLRQKLKTMSLRDAAAAVAALTGAKKKDVYRRALELDKRKQTERERS